MKPVYCPQCGTRLDGPKKVTLTFAHAPDDTATQTVQGYACPQHPEEQYIPGQAARGAHERAFGTKPKAATDAIDELNLPDEAKNALREIQAEVHAAYQDGLNIRTHVLARVTRDLARRTGEDIAGALMRVGAFHITDPTSPPGSGQFPNLMALVRLIEEQPE